VESWIRNMICNTVVGNLYDTVWHLCQCSESQLSQSMFSHLQCFHTLPHTYFRARCEKHYRCENIGGVHAPHGIKSSDMDDMQCNLYILVYSKTSHISDSDFHCITTTLPTWLMNLTQFFVRSSPKTKCFAKHAHR